jgi:hypothetical protein
MATNHTVYQNVALAISAYAEEAWTAEKTIVSTGIITDKAEINDNGEGFIGQMRWYKPLNAVENVASLTDAADGALSTLSTDIANYVKNLRTTGFRQVNMQSVISKQDGISYFASQFAKNRAQKTHEALMATLKGVAAYEASVGPGITNFDALPAANVGAFVDLNAAGEFGAAATDAATQRGLVSGGVAASGGERIFRAVGMFWKDYEPDYMYMITSPEVYADLRAKNLVDQDRIRDGNLEFATIFGGKFRLILSRTNQGNLGPTTNVNVRSTKTTFIVKPGSLVFTDVANPMPTEIDRDAAAYLGGGTTSIWYRYGFIVHPLGYDWTGASNAFASNTSLAAAASWDRKLDPLNLGILPVFHA